MIFGSVDAQQWYNEVERNIKFIKFQNTDTIIEQSQLEEFVLKLRLSKDKIKEIQKLIDNERMQACVMQVIWELEVSIDMIHKQETIINSWNSTDIS